MSRFWDGVDAPDFFAWCDDTERVNAFAAALSALVYPGGLCNFSLSTLGTFQALERDKIPVDEVLAVTRAAFNSGSRMDVSFRARCQWLSRGGFNLECVGEEYDRGCTLGPLHVRTGYWRDIFSDGLELGAGIRSLEAEAAIASMTIQQEAEDILLGLCAPEAHAGVTTGGMTCGSWYAPIEAGATYHADAKVARDLALSWVYLHDGDKVGRIAGLSLDALAARVEAAPQGANVGDALNVEHIYEHGRLDGAVPKPQDERPTHPGAVRRGPRARLPGDAELTREQVRTALATPPQTLLEALEAAAVPDHEWRAVEPLALELIEAGRQGAPSEKVKVNTGKHTRFIERHAPYHVRRLPNGGVLLATHPYRTLWALWADALLLLGIRS